MMEWTTETDLLVLELCKSFLRLTKEQREARIRCIEKHDGAAEIIALLQAIKKESPADVGA